MFIRSQNKEDLMKFDDISICQKGDFFDIHSAFAIVCYRHGTHCVLGEYSTKEKAFKVLDKLQEAYAECEAYKVLLNGDFEHVISVFFEHKKDDFLKIFKKNFVYQMPQDNEVE